MKIKLYSLFFCSLLYISSTFLLYSYRNTFSGYRCQQSAEIPLYFSQQPGNTAPIKLCSPSSPYIVSPVVALYLVLTVSSLPCKVCAPGVIINIHGICQHHDFIEALSILNTFCGIPSPCVTVIQENLSFYKTKYSVMVTKKSWNTGSWCTL